jgi:AcrR family transcriptional regulator
MSEHLRFDEKPRETPVATRRKVLEASAALLDGDGYPGVTIEAIAAKAGVAKTTIYRWWPSKAAILLDLFDAIGDERISDPATGDFVADLKAYLKSLLELMSGTIAGEAAAGMFAEVQGDPVMKVEVCAHFSEFRQIVLNQIVDRAIAGGSIRGDLDRRLIEDLIIAPFWYRLLIAHEPMNAEECDRYVDAVLSGLTS